MFSYVVQGGKLVENVVTVTVDCHLSVPTHQVARAVFVLQAVEIPPKVKIGICWSGQQGNYWALSKPLLSRATFDKAFTTGGLIEKIEATLTRWFPKSRVELFSYDAIVNDTDRFDRQSFTDTLVMVEKSQQYRTEVHRHYNGFYIRFTKDTGPIVKVYIVRNLNNTAMELTPEEIDDCSLLGL